MIFKQLFDNKSSTYTYLLASDKGREALIIDPVIENTNEYISLLKELDLRLVKVIDTHIHADHVTALNELSKQTDCTKIMGEKSKSEVIDLHVKDDDKINISVFINPVIEKLSDEIEDDWEGCLSIPGMSGLVRRFKRIKYSAIDLNGNNIVGEVEGLHARVIQHEFDHLNGVLYTSRLAHKNAFGYSDEIEKF